MRIKFTIPGQIIGKGRPKFTTVGGFARAYTPAKTANAEAMVRDFGSKAMEGRSLFDGALGLSVTLYKQRPESWSKKRKAAEIFVTGKPDLDNVVKMLGDALNGVCWRDDSQVAQINLARYYTDGPEHADVEITDDLEIPAGMRPKAPEPVSLPLFRRLIGRRRAVSQ